MPTPRCAWIARHGQSSRRHSLSLRDARVAPACPTTLCVWRNLLYLTLPFLPGHSVYCATISPQVNVWNDVDGRAATSPRRSLLSRQRRAGVVARPAKARSGRLVADDAPLRPALRPRADGRLSPPWLEVARWSLSVRHGEVERLVCDEAPEEEVGVVVEPTQIKIIRLANPVLSSHRCGGRAGCRARTRAAQAAPAHTHTPLPRCAKRRCSRPNPLRRASDLASHVEVRHHAQHLRLISHHSQMPAHQSSARETTRSAVLTKTPSMCASSQPSCELPPT